MEKRIKRSEESSRDLWDNIKCSNIHIIGVPEGEEREKRAENILTDKIAENFPDLRKETDVQVQDTQRVPSRSNQKITPRHIVIKLAEIKGKRILKETREKQQVKYKGLP